MLLRLARLAPAAAALARALSVLGDGAQVGDAARLAGLADAELEAAMAALVSAGVMESGGTVRFTHPILRTAIYGDLSPAERERLHHAAATILRERGAPLGQVAAQVMHTEPAADPGAVALLRDAARDALALGDAAGAAALLSRALDEPPADGERTAVLLELGQAHARAGRAGGDRAAVGDRRARRGRGRDRRGGDRAQRHALLRRPRRRRSGDPAPRPGRGSRRRSRHASGSRSRCSGSAPPRPRPGARRTRRSPPCEIPGGPARDVLQATTLATLAMDEVLYLRSAATAVDLAERAIAAGLPVEPHRGENWAILALAALGGRGRS